MLSRELIGGLLAVENSELLTGDGTGDHLTGILFTDDIGVVNRVTGEPRVETISRGLTNIRTRAFVEPSAVVVHPSTWELTRFEKAQDSGVYLLGGPGATRPNDVWGVDVVLTTQLASGQAIVLNGPYAGEIRVRQAPVIQASAPAGDEFIADQTMLRCYERLALLIRRPQAICHVTGL